MLNLVEDEITISKHFTSYLTKTKVWQTILHTERSQDVKTLAKGSTQLWRIVMICLRELRVLYIAFRFRIKLICLQLGNLDQLFPQGEGDIESPSNGCWIKLFSHILWQRWNIEPLTRKTSKTIQQVLKKDEGRSWDCKRDMLVEISNCKNTSELETLLSTWYSKKNLSSNCKYIRCALSASVQLWSTKALLNRTHGEDWFRLHVYSNVWDKAFLDDEELETKRSECVSQVTKILKEAKKDVKLQRLDFILRDMNNDTDVLTVEEKPSVKGVKADIRKGNMLKKHALYLWSKQVDSSVLTEKLEAISCQWQSTKFTIYGSRLLPSDTMLIYKKGMKLNYAKFNFILEEKYKNEVKTLNFADDIFNEVSFISNSTNSDGEYENGYHEENEPEDEDFVKNTKVMLDGLKEDEKGLKRFHDWEDMLLFDCSKRRKTRNK
ncbi:hypothetical protein BDF20DRAFT_834336 [Mycotypha africana]|uniref:uncharacterized protein n=1 Tax=Mycotypha africana TaxID=64632 RepID=UPI002301E46D|nr:uncharacterized protein BDF20DRAFT_834336 [Mycotypha africana]KAI8981639.1 hypothetical protein BDF20DRAFT_834336 [Mycotypha africana]